MNAISGCFVDICDADDKAPSKCFERRRQRRQLRRMHGVQDSANCLLVLPKHDCEFRLRTSRRGEGVKDSQLGRNIGLDTEVHIDGTAVEHFRRAGTVRSRRQRLSAHRIRQKSKPQSFLSGSLGVRNGFSLRDSLGDIRKADCPIGFVASLDHRSVNIGAHRRSFCSLPDLVDVPTSIETQRLSDLCGGLRIDLPAGQGGDPIADPDHRMAAFAATFGDLERQPKRPRLISQLRDEAISFVQNSSSQAKTIFGQICPNSKSERLRVRLSVGEGWP